MAPLEIYAGKKARETIMKNGFSPELFSYFLGASGGPKWFVLSTHTPIFLRLLELRKVLIVTSNK